MDFPEFKFFIQLPTEIRLNIRRHACCIPRVNDLWVRLLGQAESSIFSVPVRDGPYYYTTHTRCHILSVNKESRMVGLRHYSLEFGTNWTGEEGPAIVTATAELRIYINWTYDIVCPLPSIWYDRDFQGSDRNNYNELMKDDLYAGYHAASPKFCPPRIALNMAAGYFDNWMSRLASPWISPVEIDLYFIPFEPWQDFDPKQPIGLELLDLDDDLAPAKLMERLDEGKASIDRAVIYWEEMTGDPQRPTPEPWVSWVPPTVKYKYSSFL
jgi:hypothetical protein